MFREDKTTQMAAKFLSAAGGRLPYIKLLKLLYFADKRMLVDYGKPITYDRWYALKYGPVLSATYNLIKGTVPSDVWAAYIVTENYDLVLRDDPGSDALSIAEDRIIDAISEEFRDHGKWDIVGATHQLPEWENPGDSSREMTYDSVLRVEGFDEEDIKNILENINAQDSILSALEAL